MARMLRGYAEGWLLDRGENGGGEDRPRGQEVTREFAYV